MTDLSRARLEGRLRALRSPSPPADLEERLLAQAPRQRRLGMWLSVAAAACVALAILVMTFTATPAYADVLKSVAEATRQARAVHLVVRGLFREGEDFSFVDVEAEPTEMQMWVDARGRMRIDKADRVYNFDGKEAVYYLKRGNQASRKQGRIDESALWPADWVDAVLANPDADVVVLEDRGNVGRVVLHFEAPPLTGRAPAFFEEFEREVELSWNRESNRLVGMRRRVLVGGEWLVAAELVSVEYADRFADEIFELALPDDVRWVDMRKASPEVDALPPGEAADRFWRAAMAGDWETVEIFCPLPVTVDWLRDRQPTELLSLGEPFQTGGYPGWYIPYRVRYADGRISEHNLAMRNDNAYGRYICDGGI